MRASSAFESSALRTADAAVAELETIKSVAGECPLVSQPASSMQMLLNSQSNTGQPADGGKTKPGSSSNTGNNSINNAHTDKTRQDRQEVMLMMLKTLLLLLLMCW